MRIEEEEDNGLNYTNHTSIASNLISWDIYTPPKLREPYLHKLTITTRMPPPLDLPSEFSISTTTTTTSMATPVSPFPVLSATGEICDSPGWYSCLFRLCDTLLAYLRGTSQPRALSRRCSTSSLCCCSNLSKLRSKTSLASLWNTWNQLLFLLLFAACFQACPSLKILHHTIPRNVDGTNATAVTLDCVYAYDANDVKLVVRWFHNDSPEPIYQWIPEAGIRYVGELIKPYFDLDFTVSHDKYSRFRAIRLRGHPLPVSLSGNFSCVISSIANQDSRQGALVVYVPPHHFSFQFVELDVDRIALLCNASGVYPKPSLSFHEQFLVSNLTYDVRSPPVNVSMSYHADTSFYSASFLRPTNSTLIVGTIYECRLKLPATNYVRKKRIKIVYPTNYSTKPNRNTFFSFSSSGATAASLLAHCFPSGWMLCALYLLLSVLHCVA